MEPVSADAKNKRKRENAILLFNTDANENIFKFTFEINFMNVLLSDMLHIKPPGLPHDFYENG